jgi:hypothetical protein
LNILSCFGRRWATCDSLFLASIQLAGAESSWNDLWKDLVKELFSKKKKSKWFAKVSKALAERNMTNQVFSAGADFVSNRREAGARFAQFCFHKHLNKLTNTSADDFRRVKPFGIFPFLLRTPPAQSRFLFSFILCNWRWLDRGKCKDYPRFCTVCQRECSAWHILFDCQNSEAERQIFASETGQSFSFEMLLKDDDAVAKSAVKIGRAIFNKVAESCS